MTPTTATPRRNRPQRLRLVLAAIAGIALVASACGDAAASDPIEQASTEDVTGDTAAPSTDTEDTAVLSTDADGTTSVDDQRLATELDALQITTLSEADRDAMIFMREEEKLALDVYQELYDVWGLRIFDNIASAEQTHTDSVQTLLERYEVLDPALDQPAGVFTNPDLQALYDALVARGSESITEALLVGALIEDLDIADLQARASDDSAIDLVFSNLEKGSRNHLRAFIGQLDRNGATYTPTYISQADFAAIVNSPTERGNGR